VLLLCPGYGTDVTGWRLFDELCFLHVIPCDPPLNHPICFCYSARGIEYSFTHTPWFRSVLYLSQSGRQDRPTDVYWHRTETSSAFLTPFPFLCTCASNCSRTLRHFVSYMANIRFVCVFVCVCDEFRRIWFSGKLVRI
jgi:hypothetical protein